MSIVRILVHATTVVWAGAIFYYGFVRKDAYDPVQMLSDRFYPSTTLDIPAEWESHVSYVPSVYHAKLLRDPDYQTRVADTPRLFVLTNSVYFAGESNRRETENDVRRILHVNPAFYLSSAESDLPHTYFNVYVGPRDSIAKPENAVVIHPLDTLDMTDLASYAGYEHELVLLSPGAVETNASTVADLQQAIEGKQYAARNLTCTPYGDRLLLRRGQGSEPAFMAASIQLERPAYIQSSQRVRVRATIQGPSRAVLRVHISAQTGVPGFYHDVTLTQDGNHLSADLAPIFRLLPSRDTLGIQQFDFILLHTGDANTPVVARLGEIQLYVVAPADDLQIASNNGAVVVESSLAGNVAIHRAALRARDRPGLRIETPPPGGRAYLVTRRVDTVSPQIHVENAAKYDVKGLATPALMCFSTTFDPRWVMSSAGVPAHPHLEFHGMNVFAVSSGADLTLRHTGMRRARWIGRATIAFLGIAVAGLYVGKLRRRDE